LTPVSHLYASLVPPPPTPTLFPYTTLFRSFAAPDEARPHYSKLLERFKEMDREEFERKRALAASAFLTQGVTFTVYNDDQGTERDRKSTRLNSSHVAISYAVFCLKIKKY